jgi:hypothetical protein
MLFDICFWLMECGLYDAKLLKVEKFYHLRDVTAGNTWQRN